MTTTTTTTIDTRCDLYAATLADSVHVSLDVLAIDVQRQYASVCDLAACAHANSAAFALAECASELRDVDAYRETLDALRDDVRESHADCDETHADYDARAYVLSTRARSELDARCDAIARRLTSVEALATRCMQRSHVRATLQHSYAYSERDALRAQ